MRWEELEQQPCSLARTLSVVGDRWTLLVLRESFLGIRRFDAFEKRLGITRHVLAERLKTLVEAGVLDKVAYHLRPLREQSSRRRRNPPRRAARRRAARRGRAGR